MGLLGMARRGFAAAVTLLLLATTAQAAPPVYTAIVDAGSGGTRLFFYKVTPGPYPVSELLFKTSIQDPPDTPYEEDDGIDNYACFTGDDAAAREFYATANVNPNLMQPLWLLLKGAIDKVTPTITPADVTVKVFATAGMRTAAEVCGQAAADNLYAVIRTGMTSAGLTNPANEARTIDGATEEGLWSFINANDEYTNVFDRPGAAKLPQLPVGILEVGGSSAQIVYPIVQGDPDPKAVQFHINNRIMTVHAESWLHLGQDDMRKTLRGYKKPNGQPMAYKCWVQGFNKANDAGDVGYPSLTQNGAFRATDPDCRKFMSGHLATYMVTPPDLSKTTVKFVGLGGMKYTLDAFARVAGPFIGPRSFANVVKRRCAQNATNWPEINTQADAQRACPHGVYLSYLLADPQFGIFRKNPAQFERALLPSDVGGNSLSWIPGYLLKTYSQ